MKNLLTKTLFISLLLSAAIPSGVQASLFTEKFGWVALGTVVGLIVGTIAKLLPISEKLAKSKNGEITEEDVAMLMAVIIWGATGAVIGAVAGIAVTRMNCRSGERTRTRAPNSNVNRNI